MKKTIVFILVTLSAQIFYAQNYQADFQKYCETNDTINQLKTLKNWQAKKPKDTELYTSYFNYHFMKSRQEVLVLTNEEQSEDHFILKDSLGKNAGFIGSKIEINTEELKKGLDKIDLGITLFPNRLDMRFGKIYALGEIPDWQNFTSEIIKTVEYSNQNKNQWRWTNNEKINKSEKDFLLDIQTYQLQLYNTGNDDLLKNTQNIANKILEYYPNHIESLSNLSITYLVNGEFEKAIQVLLKAEKINPKDYIVLSNIAHTYKLKKNTKKAIEYYKKVLQYGDDNTKEFAKEQLTALEK